MQNLMHNGSIEILSTAEALRLNTLQNGSVAGRDSDRDAEREKLAERINILIDQYFSCQWTAFIF